MPKILVTIWNKLSGYKTIVGLLITLFAFLAQWLPAVLTAANVDPDMVAKVVGALIAVVGLLDKLYKQLYNEKHA